MQPAISNPSRDPWTISMATENMPFFLVIIAFSENSTPCCHGYWRFLYMYLDPAQKITNQDYQTLKKLFLLIN